MDRRTFLKSMGAIALLNAVKVSVASQIYTQRKLYKSGEPFPEIRVIVAGYGGWQLLQDQLFCTYAHPRLNLDAEHIMFIDRTGRLFQSPREDDQNHLSWDFSMEGEACERDLSRQPYFKNLLIEARAEIARFIQSADWVVLVASLDNGIAFATCDEVSELCRAAGVRVIGLVATPYYGVPEDNIRRELLDRESDQAVNNMLDNGHPLILDRGFWAGMNDDPVGWDWYKKDAVVGMISQVFKSQHADLFTMMVTSSSKLDYSWGCDRSAISAIYEAINSDRDWCDVIDRSSITSTGAVIRVSGHPDMIDKLRLEVLAELQNPDQFVIDAHPYWRKDAQFIVIVAPNDQLENDKYFYLEVLSTGLNVA